MTQKRTLTSDEQATLVLLAAIIFGLCFRMLPAWMAGFPINDGGMFHTMIVDLQTNEYVLPAYTSYNGADIPYVYPPLGFYIVAVISDLLQFQPFELLRWLPGLINTLCIPALYLFAREITKDRMQSALSALVFACTPHMFAWLSMGGGLTRSLGILFMLLCLTHVHRLFTSGIRSSLAWSIVFGGLVVLSHTEAPIYTIAIAIHIWLMKSRSTRGLLNGLMVAVGVLLVSAPWYVTVLSSHGMDPMFSALQTGAHSTQAIFRLLNLDFMTEEPYIDILGVAGLLGMAFLIAKREYFLPGMMLVIFVVLPRSAHTVGNIPSALAAGFFITGILIPALARLGTSLQSQDNSNAARFVTIFLVVLTPFLFSNAAHYALLLSQKHVSSEEQDAMQWVRANTPPNSSFLVITGEQNPFCDATSEWFPALAERGSLNTLQGQEWKLGSEFGTFLGNAMDLQACIQEGIECLNQPLRHLGPEYDYIYIAKAASTSDCQVVDPPPDAALHLVKALEDSPQHAIVYDTDGVVIFKFK